MSGSDWRKIIEADLAEQRKYGPKVPWWSGWFTWEDWPLMLVIPVGLFIATLLWGPR